MKCVKCGGEMGKPKYQSRYQGWPWNIKLTEWLSYRCTGCGVVINTECNDYKPTKSI